MSGNIKINPSVAQGVASNFGNKANDLSAIISALSSEVNSNVGSGKPAWEGQQANEFEASWNNEFKPALTKLVESLNGAKELLNKTIAAYQQLDS